MEEDDTYKCGEDDDEVRKKYRETTDVVMYLNVLRVFGFPLVLKSKVKFCPVSFLTTLFDTFLGTKLNSN